MITQQQALEALEALRHAGPDGWGPIEHFTTLRQYIEQGAQPAVQQPAEDAPSDAMNSREAFEAWAKEYGRIFLERDGNGYKFPYTQEAWVGWQAAIQHARDVAVKACEEIHDDYFRQARGGDNTGKSDARADAADDCADAIKEALK